MITRRDFTKVVSGSRNYIYARFEFSPDWAGTEKTVTFTSGEYTFVETLDNNNECIVPHEVIENPGRFSVSVFGGDLITANTVSVAVIQSGPLGGDPPTPSGDVAWGQIGGTLSNQTDLQTALNARPTSAAVETAINVAMSNTYTKAEVDDAISTAIGGALNGSY